MFQYDVAVDGEGLKLALKTALHLGHAVSGKSKDQFAKDVRPYLKVRPTQVVIISYSLVSCAAGV